MNLYINLFGFEVYDDTTSQMSIKINGSTHVSIITTNQRS